MDGTAATVARVSQMQLADSQTFDVGDGPVIHSSYRDREESCEASHPRDSASACGGSERDWQ